MSCAKGSQRFPNVDVLLEHECLRALAKGDGVELMVADLRTDTFKRFRASYVIAADGGSHPPVVFSASATPAAPSPNDGSSSTPRC